MNVILELYIALEAAGFPPELARAAAAARLPHLDAGDKERLVREIAQAFEARGVQSALAQAAAKAIVNRAGDPNYRSTRAAP